MLICRVVGQPTASNWESDALCTITQVRSIEGHEPSQYKNIFTVSRVRDDWSLYGGVLYLTAGELVTRGTRWKVNDVVPFDDDIPF